MLFQKGSSNTSSSLQSLSLEGRGLARLEGGRMRATPAAFKVLRHLQTAARIKTPTKAESGVAKNISWTGPILVAYAGVVCEHLALEKELSRADTARSIYRAMRERGHYITLNQSDAILRIFQGSKNSGEAWLRVTEHRSYGGWWKELSPEQKADITEKRRKALADFWQALTPEERRLRRKEIFDSQSSEALQIDSETQGTGCASDLRRASQISSAFKYLEKGALPGQTFAFDGVPEKMRSSWEALYARIVLAGGTRFYIYEPMGFPLINPDTGKVETYHPDFFEMRYSKKGRCGGRLIEIKGQLTEVSQRKMKLFRQYYLENDFTGLSEEQMKLQRRLMNHTKDLAWSRYRMKIAGTTQLKVWGALPWDCRQTNFYHGEIQSLNDGKKALRGMIQRLAARFSKLVPKETNTVLSNNKKREIASNASHGSEKWLLVEALPGRTNSKPGIASSQEIVIKAQAISHVYAMFKVFQYALIRADKATDRGPQCHLPWSESSFHWFAGLLVAWHGGNVNEQKTAVKKLVDNYFGAEQYEAFCYALMYLQLVRDTIKPGTGQSLIRFPSATPDDLEFLDQVRRNAADLLQAFHLHAMEAEKRLQRHPHHGRMVRFSKVLRTEMEKAAQTFPDLKRSDAFNCDFEYVHKQIQENLKIGKTGIHQVRPKPGEPTDEERTEEAERAKTSFTPLIASSIVPPAMQLRLEPKIHCPL